MKIMYLNFGYKIKFLDINVLYNVSVKLGFPDGSDGKESACNAGDLGLMNKRMATHSSILAWRIPRTEDPVGLQSMGLQRSWTQLSD